jgi:hypothetical protein
MIAIYPPSAYDQFTLFSSGEEGGVEGCAYGKEYSSQISLGWACLC